MQSDHIGLWNKCLKIIEDNLSPQAYKSWFEPITSSSYQDDKLVLRVPSSYFVERIEDTYLNLLSSVIRKVYGSNTKLSYEYNVVKGEPDTNVLMDRPKDSTVINNRVQLQSQGPSDPFSKIQYSEIDSQLNPKYTFDNYCGSLSNQLALSIGKAIATKPECKAFNPLLLFGPTGVGKTHLIQAIGVKIKETNQNARVLYLTARVFESQYTTAVRNNQVNDFINFYQSIDVLIMDDIQEFAGKIGTQNTFYHIFNHLHQNQKWLILSSDCRPIDLDGFVPRLMSRFKWGVTAELSQPDYVLRRAVLEKKSKEEGLSIPDDVLDYIAENVTDSIRELEGIMLSLVTRATFLNQEISIDIARAVISNAVKISKRQLTFEFIAETVCDHFGIESDLLYGKSRKREISDARQVVMYLAKKFTKLSSTTIGVKLSRNHATVLHACKTIEERVSIEKQLQTDLVKIENEFKK
ncbi:MAG: chromosomal replication initiator protein DnaA [Muribaculaceae bacterium]|nr:chromosomal replication initiator protein DnaA [Muribaculaceae bacterium]